MRYFEARSTIAATPEEVWPALAAVDAWPSWDSGVESVKGAAALGRSIKVESAATPGRAFPVKVTAFDGPRVLELSGGLPFGLFRGVRTFTLAPAKGGGTLFVVREEYTGPLLERMWKSIPDLQASFQQFADGLKQRVESRGGHK